MDARGGKQWPNWGNVPDHQIACGPHPGRAFGFLVNDAIMNVAVSIRHILGQIIFFLVPLVIVGYITPAIIRLGEKPAKS